jgi:hypothetical protein
VTISNRNQQLQNFGHMPKSRVRTMGIESQSKSDFGNLKGQLSNGYLFKVI